MRKVVIDTNIYTAFKRNDSRVIFVLRHLDFIGLDVTVLAELYSGFKGGKKEKQNGEQLEEFINSPRVTILSHDEITAEFYSHLFIALKSKGTPIPTNDIWIAATAMQNGLALFTLDSHFNQVDGLILQTD